MGGNTPDVVCGVVRFATANADYRGSSVLALFPVPVRSVRSPNPGWRWRDARRGRARGRRDAGAGGGSSVGGPRPSSARERRRHVDDIRPPKPIYAETDKCWSPRTRARSADGPDGSDARGIRTVKTRVSDSHLAHDSCIIELRLCHACVRFVVSKIRHAEGIHTFREVASVADHRRCCALRT